MKILELFAGTSSVGNAFKKKGHEVYTIDWNKEFKDISLYADISKLTAKDIIKLCNGKPDVIWASPDCTTYSIAGISHHRKKTKTGNIEPVSEYAKFCDLTNKNVINLINELKPQYYFIENPRGCLRKMEFMKNIPRYTVTYCQYGDKRMKPTDIWTNHHDPKFKPMCHNGDKCHEPAPRGSKAGTQGINGAKYRSIIPEELCNHIVNICEENGSGYNE